MSTPTRTPRKAGAPRRDRQRQGVIVAPEKVDDPKAERVLWDLASQTEGLGGRKSVEGDWLKNPLKWPEGFVIEISKWRTTAPIRWKVYEKSKRTHGKGIEFWLNNAKIIDAENNITASMVDHGGLGGLTDDDHTQYARTDGTRAITGLQTFNSGIATDTVAEKTAAAGVTVDGVLLKDGEIRLGPTKRLYFDNATLTSYIAEVSDDLIRIATASAAVADFDSTGLQLQQNLKFLSGTSFALTLDHAISANRTVTYPDATGTLPLLSLAQTFTAKQDIIPASGTALQVGTTNTSGDMVFGELTGATGYNGIGLQGSLSFGTGAVAQANFYSSTADAILYINNRLNSNISLRIDNVDAFIVKGTNRDTQASATFGVGDWTSGPVSMTISKGTPIFEIRETGALADERNWWFEALSGQLKLRVANDLRTVTSDVMLIDRTTTTVDSIQLITGAVAKAVMDSNGLSASAGFRLRNSGATNYHTLSQAGSTANRTITIPDETMTLAGRGANTFTAAQEISASVPLLTFISPLTTAKTRIGKGVDGERMDLSTNLSLAAGVWNLDDTAIDGTSYLQSGGIHYFRRASAGANPRTLSNYLIIQADGDITVADDTIKIGDQLGTLYQLGTAITLTAAQINDAARKSAGQTFTGLNVFSLYLELQGDVSLAPTKRLYFDGPGVLGNTYMTEASADALNIVEGGRVHTMPATAGALGGLATAQTWSAVNTFSARTEHSADIALSATSKVRLDGVAGTGDTYIYESSANMIGFVAGASTSMRMNNAGVEIGSESGITAALNLGAGTTTRASLRIYSGVAPTSPNDGDIWYDGTNVNVRVGVTTKQLAYVA